jgi:ribosome-associated protein
LRPNKSKTHPEKALEDIPGANDNISTLPDHPVRDVLPLESAQQAGHSHSHEPENWMLAVRAADSRKALDIRVLDLREVTSFTDFFLICTAANPRQAQAIADEIHRELKKTGELPVSTEGYESGEWVLLDYGDFVVHVFSDTARKFYDLERLWRHAKAVELPATAA